MTQTQREYNNSHNGLNGTVQMLKTYAANIRRAPSLTPDGRAITIDIERLLERLDKETWRWRQELDGTTTLMNHKNKRRFYP